MNDPVLVTGASGCAGGHLIQYLAAQGVEVVGWARSTPSPELAPLARWLQIDLGNREDVRRATRDLQPRTIFHCAGLARVGESLSNSVAPLTANVRYTHNLFDALHRAGVRARVLVTGSGAVYAPSRTPLNEEAPVAPDNPYSISKLAQEQLALRAVREDGLDVIVARAFNHTGPRQGPFFVAPTLARQITRIERGLIEPVLRVGNLDTERDLTDVRDVVRAYAALMQSGTVGTVYNIASGVGRPIRALLDALLSRCRVPVRVDVDPALLRARDAAALVGDTTRLRQTTGWQPEIAFDQMLDDLLHYWRGVT